MWVCTFAEWHWIAYRYLVPIISLYFFFYLFRWNLSLRLIDLKWSGPYVTAPRIVLHTKWTLSLSYWGQVTGPSLCSSTAVLLNTQSKHLDYRGTWHYFRDNSPFYHFCCYIPQPFCLKSQNSGVIVLGSNVSKVIILQALSSEGNMWENIATLLWSNEFVKIYFIVRMSEFL